MIIRGGQRAYCGKLIGEYEKFCLIGISELRYAASRTARRKRRYSHFPRSGDARPRCHKVSRKTEEVNDMRDRDGDKCRNAGRNAIARKYLIARSAAGNAPFDRDFNHPRDFSPFNFSFFNTQNLQNYQNSF